MSSSPRIKIRCPQCMNDGTARAELTNRKVSCKVCSHIFRAIPVDEDSASPPVRPNLASASSITPVGNVSDSKGSRARVEAMELEIRRLRDDLSTEHAAVEELTALRERLAQAIDVAKKAEAREKSLRQEVDSLRDRLDQAGSGGGEEPKNGLREEELRFLRDQLDKARAESEAESRRRREATATLASKTADHSQAIAAKEADHAKALGARTAEHTLILNAKQVEFGEVVRGLRDQLDKALADAKSVESRRQSIESAKMEADARHADEARNLREELSRTQAELGEAKKALDGLRLDVEKTSGDHSRVVDEMKGKLGNLEGRVKEAEAIRVHRDQLGQELESHKSRLSEAERRAEEHRGAAEGLRGDREQVEARLSAEVAELRSQLEKARADGHSEFESIRRERDEARNQRDRFSDELDALQARVVEAERLAADWDYAGTELEMPRAVEAPVALRLEDDDPESATVYDGGSEQLRADFDRSRAEAERLAAELTDATDKLSRKDAELVDLAAERDRVEAAAIEAGRVEARRVADEGKAEAESIRRELEEARAAAADATAIEAPRLDDRAKAVAEAEARAESLRAELEQAKIAAEAATRENAELAARLQDLEGAAPLTVFPTAMGGAPAVDPAALELERKRAVDEAVKGAWADFERRLAETQAKLKAANTRADLMEVEAREARQTSSGSESDAFDDTPSMTSIRILDARGTTRITPADAEARLALAKQLAVERKDKTLIDRISKMSAKVSADLEARNYTLAETLVRGAEIEAGLDPGGFSINGLKIFRASPTIVNSLAALNPAFERVMRQGDLGAIQSTMEEMKTILGEQAGLPELRRPGRTPSTKRPIDEGAALRLFLGAIEGESWLVKPISLKKPLPDTSLTTYATLIEACRAARTSAERQDPEQVELLDKIITASCLMLTRRQQPDGHFSFLDPRGKASKAASVVEAMVKQRPDSVKDGWVVAVDPAGMALAETGACGVALAVAGQALGRSDWSQAALKAADWAMAQPCMPHFVANAASAGLLARSYLDTKQDKYLDGLTGKLTLGVLPGQAENGRWIDPYSATTSNHLTILRALQDSWEAIPAGRGALRDALKESIGLAMASLLAECKALGVPPQGNALRDLLRHRTLFPGGPDPKLDSAIIDSATVIQELCHDGPKPKLGVASDQLAALIHLG